VFLDCRGLKINEGQHRKGDMQVCVSQEVVLVLSAQRFVQLQAAYQVATFITNIARFGRIGTVAAHTECVLSEHVLSLGIRHVIYISL